MNPQQPPSASTRPDPPATAPFAEHGSRPNHVAQPATSGPAAAATTGPKQQKGKGKDSNPNPPQKQPQSKKAMKKAAAAGTRRDIQGPGSGSELYKRMNFLMQAAQLMAHQAGHIAPVQPQTQAKPKGKAGAKGKRARTTPRVAKSSPLAAVARHLGREMMMTARKNALKIDPSVKHSMCRRCWTVLVPGLSMQVQVLEPYNKATEQQPATQPANPAAMDVDEPETPSPAISKPASTPAITQTCSNCGFTRGHPVRPGYVPFHDRAAVVEEPPTQ
ncbi:hypothetical protein BCR44DRAFT_1440766 [Catenaria anguillulae PL171]|uniref:RNAse P Rpr2/Rpp21/SNM1 subunit domain-domain-containing protein n=1 Tax=Catenaria anguillulae PL171 TaxID=765915 RepID=A0A1Y2HED1_9FUNG|nr:hypothetical protein BCR44DRAFT_1440766 [Catenaria anguillulae PL171]